jgi:hypothetical protein
MERLAHRAYYAKDAAHRLLANARVGKPLACLLEAAVAEDPGFDLATSLRDWVAAGVIADNFTGDEE